MDELSRSWAAVKGLATRDQGDLPGAIRVVSSIVFRADLDPYLSLQALSGYAHLSRRTLQALVNDPRDPLPSYRVGGKILVRRSEFDQWMARRRNRKPLDAARLAAADAQALLTARPRT